MVDVNSMHFPNQGNATMSYQNFRRSLQLAIVATMAAIPIRVDAQSIRPGSSARTTASGSAYRSTGTTGTGSRTSTGSGGARQYRSNTELGDAIIQIDPETRSLVIVTDEETHLQLDKVIKQLDQPKPQVLIKVVFLEVTYNNGLDLGIEGNYTFNLENSKQAVTGTKTETTTNSRTTDNGGTRNTTSTLTTPLGTIAAPGETVSAGSLFGLSALTEGTFVRVLSDNWSATLHALSTKGKVEVLSRPSIVARNNQEAVIVVGQEVPFVTNSRVTDNGQTINTIQYDNVGIILRVTPFITSEGSVEMIVAPEISNLTDQTVPISENASAPVIAKRSAETVVVTPNGRTVVIGGLMETQSIESIRKVPLLGDIPWLGAAFRRTIKNDVKKELMIFLTPQILQRPETLRAAAYDEVDHTNLVEKAFTEKDFDKYLGDTSLFPNSEEAPSDLPVRRAVPVVSTKKTTTTTTKNKSTSPAVPKVKSSKTTTTEKKTHP